MNRFHEDILAGIPVILPEPKPYDTTVCHAPKRKDILTDEEKKLEEQAQRHAEEMRLRNSAYRRRSIEIENT